MAKLEQVKLELAKQEQAKQEQAKLELARQEQLRKQQVPGSLKQLDSALQKKNRAGLKAIWPGTSQDFFETIRRGDTTTSPITREEDIQFPQGPDQASAKCDLVTKQDKVIKHQRAILTLRNTGGIWKIELFKVN